MFWMNSRYTLQSPVNDRSLVFGVGGFVSRNDLVSALSTESSPGLIAPQRYSTASLKIPGFLFLNSIRHHRGQ